MNNDNEKKVYDINAENINSKSQMNCKNTNTANTNINHNKKYIQYIKPLLLLLQKAEQIITIINLPSSSIDKYNQLKEISFKKCGLEFTPLVKNDNLIKNIKKENNNHNIDIQNQNLEKEIKFEQEFSEIKNKLIESILTLIETTDFTNSNIFKENLSSIPSFNNISNIFSILKEQISKISIDKEPISSEKEKILNYISRSEQNIISILYENAKKFDELKKSYMALNSKIDKLFKYINNIDELITPIWNKYYNKDIEWFKVDNISDNYELKTYTKIHFLLNFMNQLFLDNKNLMQALTQMEQKKNEAYNILKLPYVRKAIEKSEYLKKVEELLHNIKSEKEKNNGKDMNKLIQDGKELINCIRDTINEDGEKKSERNDSSNTNIINAEDIENYNDDMNIFLGKLMNGIQNILNKVDISIKKDELVENMMKVNNISKNKNLDISSINNVNTNMNINTTFNNGITSKDMSFISTINNDSNNKTQTISFPIYKKKTNHISGSNINFNKINENEKSDKKNKKEINLNNNNNINNVVNNEEQNNDIKNKNNNNIKIISDDMNEEKTITIGDIGNNLSDAENSQKNKSEKDDININIKKEKEVLSEEGIEKLKYMVLEDFKNRINNEKEKEKDDFI